MTRYFTSRATMISLLAGVAIVAAGCGQSSAPETTPAPEITTTTSAPAETPTETPTTTSPTTPDGAATTHGAGSDPDHPPLPGPAADSGN